MQSNHADEVYAADHLTLTKQGGESVDTYTIIQEEFIPLKPFRTSLNYMKDEILFNLTGMFLNA